MNKHLYTTPELRVKLLMGTELLQAVSGSVVNGDTPADQGSGMDVKADRGRQGYNVWDDDWSR